MINASVAMSTELDSNIAGRHVAKEALKGLSGKPKLAILSIDSLSRKKYDYQAVLNGIFAELGAEIPLIGGTVNGLIINDRIALKSVGLLLLGGDINIDELFAYPRSRIDKFKIAQDISNKGKKYDIQNNRTLLMFMDGGRFPAKIMEQQKMLNSRMVSLMSGLVKKIFTRKLEEFDEKGMGYPATQEIINKMYEYGWNIPIIGNVTTALRDYEGFEFYNKKPLEDYVLGAILSAEGSSKLGIGYSAGGEPMGVKCKINKSVASALLRINDKPALRGFCDAINIDIESLRELKNAGYINTYNILGTRENINGKEKITLAPTLTDPDLENLVLSGFPLNNVPSEVEIFKSNLKILLKTGEECIKQAMEGISNPRFLLGFECGGRFSSYGDNIHRNIQMINDVVGKDVPKMIIGAGGEIYGIKPNDMYMLGMTIVSMIGGD